MERDVALLVAAAAGPPPKSAVAQPAQPAPWPAPAKTPPARGASAAESTLMRSARTTKNNKDVDKLGKMMEIMVRNHESAQTRFNGIQERIEAQATQTTTRLAVEEKMNYGHEQARERFERLEERIAKLERGEGGRGEQREGGSPEVVFGNFFGEVLAEEVTGAVRPLLAARGLMAGATELYARSKRHTVLFLRLVDPTSVTTAATRLRQAKVEYEG